MDYKRFLYYSLRHARPVRCLVQEDKLRYVNLTVIQLNDEDFICLRSGRKKPFTLRYDQVLAVSYARGDDGDTLKNEQREHSPFA